MAHDGDLLPEDFEPGDASTDDEFGEEEGGGGEAEEVVEHEEDEDDGDDDGYVYPPYLPLIPTCGLCRFYFEPGEVMLHYNSKEPVPLRCIYDVPRVGEDFGDRAIHEECLEACRIGGSDAAAPEDLCKIAGGVPDFVEPPISMTIRRHRWIKRSIAQDLQLSVRGRLPLEICEAIAEYCTRQRAAQIIRDIRPKDAKSVKYLQRLLFDCEDPLWVHFVEIEGVRYVRSLSYSQLFPDDTLLLPAGYEATASFNVYFAEDYRGIRQILATQSDEAPSIDREAGLHWVICCRQQRTPFYVRWKNDGVKLRGFDVTKTKNNPPDWKRKRWATFPMRLDAFPQPPRTGIPEDLAYYDAVQADSPTAHIDEFDQHYQCGIYVPIDPDERVSALWMRRYTPEDGPDVWTLIFRTSKGRSHVLGREIGTAWGDDDRTESKKFTYIPIANLPKGQARMFYNSNWHLGLWLTFEKPSLLDSWLGIKSTTPPTREFTVSVPGPDPYNPERLDYGILTWAPLEGVKSLRVCRSWQPLWGRPSMGRARWGDDVVGLLLTYTDSTQRCVGQVRPDSLEDAVDVRSKIWLGSIESYMTPLKPYEWFPTNMHIDCVCVDKPGLRESCAYLEVPLTGRLEWHCRYGHSSVAHFDTGKAYDEINMALAHGIVNNLSN
ncbi:hypothetical protein FVEN_g9166 [Fusarium venenatum]|nr:hypothetical protein FVEN_g9166 [Fusarium venenatum]